MFFFDDIKTKAKASRQESGRILELTCQSSWTEYSSFNAHCKLLMLPFARSWQLVRNIARITYSACVFMGALFTGNGNGIMSTLSNIGLLIHASILDVLDIACSMLSIVTRSIATLYHGGYTPDPISHTLTDLTQILGENVIHDTSWEELSPYLQTINIRPSEETFIATPEQQDLAIHRQAFNFI